MVLSWPLYGVFEPGGRYCRPLVERIGFTASYIPYCGMKAVVGVHLL